MKNCLTVLIEYESSDDMPRFSHGMKALGGTVTVVMFDDAFEQIEKLELLVHD